MTRWGSCQCQLADVLSVREEYEVTLPYFSLKPETRKWCNQGKSGKICLCTTASVRSPLRGHRADSESPQGSPQFLVGGLLRSRCVTVMMFDVSLGEQCGSVLALCLSESHQGGRRMSRQPLPLSVSEFTAPTRVPVGGGRRCPGSFLSQCG